MVQVALMELVGEAEVLEAGFVEGLQVFGLRGSGGSGLEYSTLDEALDAGSFTVAEVSESGNVQTLKVANSGVLPVFIMDGEQLVGAKQNRMVRTSMMVPAKSDLPLPVFCIEAHRWDRGSVMFRSGGSSSHLSLRRLSRSYDRGRRRDREGRHDADAQSAVWDEVRRKLGRHQVESGTESLYAIYMNCGKRREAVRASIPAPRDCSGAVFAIGGRIVAAECFDKPSTLAKLWPKLLDTYMLEAMELPTGEDAEGNAVACEEVTDWLRRSSSAKQRDLPTQGSGRYVSLETDDVLGGALLVEEKPVHVELFAAAGLAE